MSQRTSPTQSKTLVVLSFLMMLWSDDSWSAPSPLPVESREKTCSTIPSQVLAPQLDIHKARNQSQGWCFAFASADLLSVKLGQSVSAFGMANAYYRDSRLIHSGGGIGDLIDNINQDFALGLSQSTLDKQGGFVARMLDTAIENGFVCSENSSPSEFPVDESGLGLTSEDTPLHAADRFNSAIVTLEAAYDSLEKTLENEWNLERIEKELDHLGVGVRSPYRLGQINVQDPHQGRMLSEVLCEDDDFRQALKDLFPRVSFKDFLRVAQESSRAELIQNLSRNNCEAIPVPQKKFKIRSVYATTETSIDQRTKNIRKMIALIDQQLSARNPVVATYDSAGLFNPPSAIGVQLKQGKQADNSQYVHATLITGRHWDEEGRTCRYELKNSWGRECKFISPQILCDRGILYLTEEQLGDMLYGVDWLQ
jgi:hypothetical protein